MREFLSLTALDMVFLFDLFLITYEFLGDFAVTVNSAPLPVADIGWEGCCSCCISNYFSYDFKDKLILENCKWTDYYDKCPVTRTTAIVVSVYPTLIMFSMFMFRVLMG